MRLRIRAEFRYNKRCKWREGYIHQVDYTRGLPFAVGKYSKGKYRNGSSYTVFGHLFRVNKNNLRLL